MQPIPKPHILDPDRILDNDRGDFTADHKARAKLLDAALHETCAYAQHLWDDLNSTRKYLLDSLPPDPRTPGPHRACAAPEGPDDEQGWQNWIDAFAEVTSVLCGPHGDSGFGLGRARQEAQLRRSAPIMQIAADQSRHPSDPATRSPHNQPHDAEPADVEPRDIETEAPHDHVQPAPEEPTHRLARSLATTVLALLALRGLRPRPRYVATPRG